MAVSANTVWEVRQATGADTNGGGFVAGATGTDYSQQAAAQFSGTNLVVDAVTNTKVTSATHNYVAADVGNIIQITAGAGWTTGFYQIASVTSNAANLDRSPAAVGTTGGTWAEGGALATLATLAGMLAFSQKAYVTGAFTSAATITFSPANINPAGGSPPTRVIGYGSVRGDSGHATLTLQTNTGLNGIACASNGFMVEQIDVDCASLGTSTGISLSGANQGVRNCKVSNFTTYGIRLYSNGGHAAYDCEVTGGSSAATAAILTNAGGESIVRCFVHDNACPAIVMGQGSSCLWNLVVNNSGASSDGILASNACLVIGNTVHNNGRDGIRQSGNVPLAPQQWKNNLLTSNGGYGISNGGTPAIPAVSDDDGNAFYSNTSGTRSNMDSTAGIFGVSPYTNVKDVILTASPYVGPTTGTTANFALNSTAGGGAACRSAGAPGTWPGNSGTTGYQDMGAVQSPANIRVHPGMAGGMRG